MPWLAIPYSLVSTRASLASLYNIQGIPSLVLLDCKETSLDLITTEARHELSEDPEGELFPWYPRMVNVLSPRHCPKLHDAPALILFIGNVDDILLLYVYSRTKLLIKLCYDIKIVMMSSDPKQTSDPKWSYMGRDFFLWQTGSPALISNNHNHCATDTYYD